MTAADRRPRVLITGVTGLLGSALVRATAGRDDVWGIARRPQAAASPCRTLPVDIRHARAVEEAVNAIKPAVVFHTAALTSVNQCEADPDAAFAVNVQGTKNLLQALGDEWVGRFIFLSSDSVFDGARGAYREDDAPSPLHVYGRTKVEGEEAVLCARPDALVIRTAFYGWNVLPQSSLAEWVLSSLQEGRPFSGFRDLLFSPLLTDDLAALLVDLMWRPIQGVLHVAASDGCSKYEFACRLARLFGFPEELVMPVDSRTVPLHIPRPKNVTLRVERAAAVLGRPLPTVDEGLQKFFAGRKHADEYLRDRVPR
ncbi:MAG: SDR family oxidoreductase [Candidatus Omnitrophica bacterium]|nr:SDR family oxidoreductase [Candidatus Omnitrophota bacterium]